MHQMHFCDILNYIFTNIMYTRNWKEKYRCIINIRVQVFCVLLLFYEKSSPFHKMFSLLYLISRGIYGTWNTIKSSHAYILIQFWWTEGWMAITHLLSNFVMLYWTTNYISWIPRMIQRGSMTLCDVFLPVPWHRMLWHDILNDLCFK